MGVGRNLENVPIWDNLLSELMIEHTNLKLREITTELELSLCRIENSFVLKEITL